MRAVTRTAAVCTQALRGGRVAAMAAICRLRAARRLPRRGAGRARRLDRLVLPAALRHGSAVRAPARPGRRALRASRSRAAARTSRALPRRHARAGDDAARRRRARRGCSTACRSTDPLDPAREHRPLLRVVEGVRGRVELRFARRAALRLRRGRAVAAPPRRAASTARSAATTGCCAAATPGFEPDGDTTSRPRSRCAAGERVRLLLAFRRPRGARRRDVAPPPPPSARRGARRHDRAGGAQWSRAARGSSAPTRAGARRSALVLKALTYAPTGAIVAAADHLAARALGAARATGTTATPGSATPSSPRAALAELGHDERGRRFRRFIERSAAGRADDLQICLRRRRRAPAPGDRARPPRGLPRRRGRCASATPPPTQLQLDAYGELLDLSWRWHQRGHSPDDDYWRFLLDLVDAAAERWREPDRGIWEWRGEPRHFVHSKVMCWVGARPRARAGRGAALRQAPERALAGARATRSARRCSSRRLRRAARARSCRRSARADLDAALLLLPALGFVAYDDERMVGTVDGDPRGARATTASCAATTPTTGCPAARARSSPARSGSPSAWRARAGSTRRARCSTARWPPATTSACSPRSTTRAPASCSATSRRRSPTSSHIEAALALAGRRQQSEAHEPHGRPRPAVERLDVAVHGPHRPPESDGTLAWDATTIVLVEVARRRPPGLGWTYGRRRDRAGWSTGMLAGAGRGRDPLDVPAPGRRWRRGAQRGAARAGGVRRRRGRRRAVGPQGAAARRPAVRAARPRSRDASRSTARAASAPTPTAAARAARRLGGAGHPAREDEGRPRPGARPAPRRASRATAIGDDVELMVDANGAYDRRRRCWLAQRFAEHGVRWFEEPVSSDDLAGLRLRARPRARRAWRRRRRVRLRRLRLRALLAPARSTPAGRRHPLRRHHRLPAGRRAVRGARPCRSRRTARRRSVLHAGAPPQRAAPPRVLPRPRPHRGHAVRRRARAAGGALRPDPGGPAWGSSSSAPTRSATGPRGPSKNTDTPAAAHPRRLDPPAMLTWQSHASLIARGPRHPRLRHIRRTDHFWTNPCSQKGGAISTLGGMWRRRGSGNVGAAMTHQFTVPTVTELRPGAPKPASPPRPRPKPSCPVCRRSGR